MATTALSKYGIERDVAAHIKKEFDKKYHPTWHCIVGQHQPHTLDHTTHTLHTPLHTTRPTSAQRADSSRQAKQRAVTHKPGRAGCTQRQEGALRTGQQRVERACMGGWASERERGWTATVPPSRSHCGHGCCCNATSSGCTRPACLRSPDRSAGRPASVRLSHCLCPAVSVLACVRALLTRSACPFVCLVCGVCVSACVQVATSAAM